MFVCVPRDSTSQSSARDRLYTDAVNSQRRRSTQTALHHMVVHLCQMLAPILVFTTEEAWGFILGKQSPSVHLSIWEPTEREEVIDSLAGLFSCRERVLPRLEEARQQKRIGKSLEAVLTSLDSASLEAVLKYPMHTVVISGSEPTSVRNAQSEQEWLELFREILNVSKVEIVNPDSTKNSIVITPASELGRTKCERCWHWEPDVSSDPAYPGLCPRCVTALKANAVAA